MLTKTRAPIVVLAFGFAPLCLDAETIHLEVTVKGAGPGETTPSIQTLDLSQPAGTGEEPLPLNGKLDYYSRHFGGYDYAGYARAENFYNSPKSFGASVGFDVIEGDCADTCGINTYAEAEINLVKTSSGQTEIPFTISAADLFVSGGNDNFASFYVDIQTSKGTDDFLQFFSLYDNDKSFTLDEPLGGSILTGILDLDATIGAELRTAAEGFPYTRKGASFVTDTYHGALDISTFEVGSEFTLNYAWSVEVETRAYSASVYAKFQDPLGPIALDLSGFYEIVEEPDDLSTVPVPAAGLLIATALMFLGMCRRRKQVLF